MPFWVALYRKLCVKEPENKTCPEFAEGSARLPVRSFSEGGNHILPALSSSKWKGKSEVPHRALLWCVGNFFIKMIQSYQNSARKAGFIFIILNVVALFLAGQHVWLWLRINPVGKLFWAAIIISAFVWYYNFAKAKGYSGCLSLLGFLHLVGFIIILLLPDKTKQLDSSAKQ